MIPFTQVALCVLTIGLFLGQKSFVYAVGCILTIGTGLSFLAAHFLDGSCFSKLSIRHKQTTLQFLTITVFFAHILPVLIVLTFPPMAMSRHALLTALCIHVVWGVVASGGTMNLDKIYVPLKDTCIWRYLWTIAIASELCFAAALA